MTLHPAVHAVVAWFQAGGLHAARSAREVMAALAQLAADSPAGTTQELADEIEAGIDALLAVLPSYAPPLNVMHLVMSRVEDALDQGASVSELQAILTGDARDLLRWSEQAQTEIAMYGAELIRNGGTLCTYSLSETVMRTMREARARGKDFSVLITESRPNRDGLTTAAELAKEGIPAFLSVDACVGELVVRADQVLIGAEAIMADGSAICKVGTFAVCLVARTHGVPVYVLVDTLKFNLASLFGLPLWMKPLKRSDVLSGDVPPEARVAGHLFDQTPADLIRGIVTEKGILSPAGCTTLMREMRTSRRLMSKLPSWAYRTQ